MADTPNKGGRKIAVTIPVPGLNFRDRIDLIIRLLFAVAISIGCYFVIAPFLPAIVIAAILAVVTWPLYQRVLSSFVGSTTIAASLMVLLIIFCVLIPSSILLVAVAQQIPKGVAFVKAWMAGGFVLPDWLFSVPYAGPWLKEQITLAIDPATLGATLQKVIEPVTHWLLNAAVNVGNGLFQLALVTFIVFFFYRDGLWFTENFSKLMQRIGGDLSSEFSGILVNTTRSVVFGLVGTALGQALVAGIGFWIVDANAILMLCFFVFVLSIVPVGPPLVWGSVAIWLYSTGEIGMAVFMVLWGMLAVSSVDNFIKPVLIARGTSLPLALIFLGVFGGVLAFGFLGVILGPILLAIGVAMLRAWLSNPVLAAKLGQEEQK